MGYEDKSIQCADCGVTFTFSADEQENFASRGYKNEPKRCPACRQASRARTDGGSGGDRTGLARSSPRQMYPAKCAQCGKDTEVPFEPRTGKPVYCSDCYRKMAPRR